MGNIKVAYTMNRTIFKAQPNLKTDPRLCVTKYSLSRCYALIFAKQCTLHSSIVENTFHFAKLSCKLGQVF